MVRVHRIPYSTNVERVALAAGAKGLAVEWIDHDPADRSALVALSGQDLVPVAEIDGAVVSDSIAIVDRLDHHIPDPPLYPADPRERARTEAFCEWFNLVWKGPPNALDEELRRAEPDPLAVEDLIARTRSWPPRFESLLKGAPFMSGESFGAMDVVAFPHLKYAVIESDPGDTDPFHPVLERCLKPSESYPLLRDWVGRVDALPRA